MPRDQDADNRPKATAADSAGADELSLLNPQTGLPTLERRIFANRNLRLDQVAAIGFDMDYTIARYRRELLEELAHGLTIGKLIARGYPESIRTTPYDPNFVIRGLTVDKQLGNIIKLDRHNHVAHAYHGRRPLSKDERREIYRREKMHFIPPRFALVDTIFSLPEMCLYADLIEQFEKISYRFDPWKLFEDTRESIDEVHRDDSLKSVVKKDPERFVNPEPLLGRTLHKLRSSGKKLSLLTNSLWDYTDVIMSYLLNGLMAEYPSWRSYFEFIVVGAKKPGFFNTDAPFVELDAAGNALEQPATQLKKAHLYQGGNLRSLQASLGCTGEEILYVGDHIYGDILRSKKDSLWRTVLVVEELEDEIRRMSELQNTLQTLYTLEKQRRHLDQVANLLRQQLSKLERLGETSEQFHALRLERDNTKKLLKETVEKAALLQSEVDQSFNPYWGMVFKEEGENSRFGEQVEDYACLYTSRVTNFLGYSSHQYFRSARDMMPHERDLTTST